MDLGLERAGMECAWQVEIDPFCRKVLTKHWPNVPKFNDVREVGKLNLERVDLIAGGFPCQDVSEAGARVGLDGQRSGLWREFHRIVSELRPRFVLVENVTGLFDRGIDRVLGDLAAIGYDAEWSVLSACAFTAPHARERVFLLAYPTSERSEQRRWLKQQTDSEAQRDVSIWKDQSGPVRMADGVSRRMDRLRSIGNAVVPQVAQWIGERIAEHENKGVK